MGPETKQGLEAGLGKGWRSHLSLLQCPQARATGWVSSRGGPQVEQGGGEARVGGGTRGEGQYLASIQRMRLSR